MLNDGWENLLVSCPDENSAGNINSNSWVLLDFSTIMENARPILCSMNLGKNWQVHKSGDSNVFSTNL